MKKEILGQQTIYSRMFHTDMKIFKYVCVCASLCVCVCIYICKEKDVTSHAFERGLGCYRDTLEG